MKCKKNQKKRPKDPASNKYLECDGYFNNIKENNIVKTLFK